MVESLATFAVGAVATGAGVGLARCFDARLKWLFSVALAALVASALVLMQLGDRSILPWFAVAICGWTALAITDALRHEIPDLISIPFLLIGLIQQVVQGVPIKFSLIAIAVLFGLTLLASLTAARWRRGVGGGDVVLLGVALAWLGPSAMVDVLVLVTFLLIPQIAHVLVTGSEDGIAFAPAFGAATLIITFGGPIF